MTMIFRTLKCNIVNILGNAELGRYQTIGFERQQKAASEVLCNDRMVQVYYKSGFFPKSAGRITGPVQHDITMYLGLTVAMAAKGNISLLNNASATAEQRAAALVAFQEAADLADQSIDELSDIVYQVIMDATNFDMGFSKGVVSNRWIESIEKNDPPPQGEYVVLTAVMPLTLRVEEQITGESLGSEAINFDNVLDIVGDDIEKTGILI
jgi:hypothetical protein